MPYNHKEYMKEYNKKNKEKYKAQRQTPEGKKSKTIRNWRFLGVIETDYYTFDELYEAYIYCGHCELCDKEFPDTFDRCLDHDHKTGIFRNIVCRGCNTWRCDD